MKSQLNLKTSLLAAALFAASGAFAATTSMPKADYAASKDRIAAEYKADKAACKPMKGNAEDVCEKEAKGKQKVALADLEYARSGKQADATKLAMVKADTAYDVAKEKCDDQSGNAKDVCVKEAKAAHVRATADAKAHKEVVAARKEASEDKMTANYKVAAEKCDALAGDAKAACMDHAKAEYGKK